MVHFDAFTCSHYPYASSFPHLIIPSYSYPLTPYRAGKSVVLGVVQPMLAPPGTTQPDVLLLNQLPYYEDVRVGEFPSFDHRVVGHLRSV